MKNVNIIRALKSLIQELNEKIFADIMHIDCLVNN